MTLFLRAMPLLALASSPVFAQAAATPPAAQPPANVQQARAQITLDEPTKYALVSGLGSEVGTPFILNNLADASKLCQSLGTCITTDQIQTESAVDPAAFADVHMGLPPAYFVTALAKAVQVKGKPPVAIVSLVAIYPAPGTWNYTPMLVQTSVLDVATGKSQIFYADIEFRMTGADLRNWIPQSGLNYDLQQRFGLPTNFK